MATKEELMQPLGAPVSDTSLKPATPYNTDAGPKPKMPKLHIQFAGNKKDLKIEGTVTIHGDMVQVQQFEFFLPESSLALPEWKGRMTNRWYYPTTAIKEIHVDETDMN